MHRDSLLGRVVEDVRVAAFLSYVSLLPSCFMDTTTEKTRHEDNSVVFFFVFRIMHGGKNHASIECNTKGDCALKEWTMGFLRINCVRIRYSLD